jgi:hypothetical protein
LGPLLLPRQNGVSTLPPGWADVFPDPSGPDSAWLAARKTEWRRRAPRSGPSRPDSHLDYHIPLRLMCALAFLPDPVTESDERRVLRAFLEDNPAARRPGWRPGPDVFEIHSRRLARMLDQERRQLDREEQWAPD